MTIYILEDDPQRMIKLRRHFIGDTIVHSDTAAEFIDALKEYDDPAPLDAIFLDHDLGGMQFVDSSDTNTGMEVVRWMVENKVNVGIIYVHTLNDLAGEIMVDKLQNAGYNTVRLPFIYMNFEL